MPEQRVTISCFCGHRATVTLPDDSWRHRDWILPRAKCTKCGKLRAIDLKVAQDDGSVPGPSYTPRY